MKWKLCVWQASMTLGCSVKLAAIERNEIWLSCCWKKYQKTEEEKRKYWLCENMKETQRRPEEKFSWLWWPSVLKYVAEIVRLMTVSHWLCGVLCDCSDLTVAAVCAFAVLYLWWSIISYLFSFYAYGKAVVGVSGSAVPSTVSSSLPAAVLLHGSKPAGEGGCAELYFGDDDRVERTRRKLQLFQKYYFIRKCYQRSSLIWRSGWEMLSAFPQTSLT